MTSISRAGRAVKRRSAADARPAARPGPTGWFDPEPAYRRADTRIPAVRIGTGSRVRRRDALPATWIVRP